MGRAMNSAEYAVVRSDIRTLLQEINQKASGDPRLSELARKMELPLIYFVDWMVIEGKLKFSNQWRLEPLAYERNELTGDEKFFDLLQETLNDPSEAASECLVVYYTCLGLGFMGMNEGQPEQLRRYMNQIIPRIQRWVEVDDTKRICSEAYEHTDTRDLREPPGVKMTLILVLFACVALSVMAFYYWTYRGASDELRRALGAIGTHEAPPVQGVSSPDIK
jgi:type IV/VI secretion system ImpK/VasF family protein